MEKMMRQELEKLSPNEIALHLRCGLDELSKMQERYNSLSYKYHLHTFIPVVSFGVFQNKSQVLKLTLETDALLDDIVEMHLYLAIISSLFEKQNIKNNNGIIKGQ